MSPPPDSGPPERRRTFLRLVGAGAAAGALQGVVDAGETDTDEPSTFVVEQGDRCVEVAPLSGDVPVEELYEYAYPSDRYDGPPGSLGSTYSSEGTTDLQRDRTSILFLYDGPEGLSLVVVHGHLDGERDAGATVTFTFEGVPEEASWVVRDDYYLQGGEPVASNYDRWDVDGAVHTVDWAYSAGRTDGGALRGLGSEFAVSIDPSFNGDATLAADHDNGPIEAWEVLGGDRDAPERYPLRLERPVTVRAGSCGGRAGAGGTGDRDAGGDDGATRDDDRRSKHEKKQRKHREKHRRKQEKHRRKHRKKQRKHRKEKRKHRKHGG